LSSGTGIEHTIKKVSDEAAMELLNELRSGKSSATEVITQRMNETLSEVQRISDQQERQADALRRQITGTAEMTARNKSLEIVEDNLNKAFSDAMGKLKSLASGPSYERVLTSMILEAIDQIGGDDFVIKSNSQDQKIIPRVFEQISRERKVRLTLDTEPLPKSTGGVVVRSTDGYVTFDNTFEARLERLKPILRKQMAQMFMETH